MIRWVSSRRTGKYHLVVNNQYSCNHAIGKIYRKETLPLPTLSMCCKNCLRKAKIKKAKQ
jgi:hypothetical protein